MVTPLGPNETLDDEAKHELLELARRTLERVLNGEAKEEYTPKNPILNKGAGVFVTLNKHDRLRGCIGTFNADYPLYRNVQDMAIAAALHDPRFPPVHKDELDDIKIEISVLSGLFPIKPEEVEIGKHGLMIEKGSHHGVLLPQVAVEWGWDREEFLDEVCLKAGLPIGAWRQPDAKLYGFTAQVFEENFLEGEE